MNSTKRIITDCLTFLILFFCGQAFCDCFQDLADKVDNNLFARGLENTAIEESFPILLNEIESCTGVSGIDLYEKILENYVQLKFERVGSLTECYITKILITKYLIDIMENIKVNVLKGYRSEGKRRDYLYGRLHGVDLIKDDIGSLYADFSRYNQLLDNEVNMNTDLSQALIDYMFKRSPGQALLLLNNSLSVEEIENVKNTINPLIKWHSWRDPKSWEDEDLDSGKATINNLISSNYAYIDLFIAEIVNVVHDLRTPEVDAFLKQSTHPLVQKRENEPFVYVPLVVPE